MKLFFRKLRLYAALPEMISFWVFLPITLAILIVAIFFVDSAFVVYLIIILSLAELALLFLNNLRLATSNLEVKIERNQLSGIVNNLADGIIAYDTDFRILVFNRAAENIFEMSAPEVVGHIFSPDASRGMRSKLLPQALFPSLAPVAVNRSEPGAAIQIVDLTFDEPKLELRVSTVRIIDPSKRLLGFLKIVHDRTREVEIIKSKSDFITVAAHQLRTPLSAIGWTFETLASETLSEQGRQFMDNGAKAAKKVLKIVNDLLDVSKIEEGRFGFQFKAVNFIEFVEKILGEAAAFASKYSVKVYFEKPAEEISLTIDTEKLGIALNNLIDNAIKYNTKNGSVTVKIVRVPNQPYVEITVADTGLGVPPDDLAKLFTKFFRSENVMRVETEGSGLGLYIVRNIIQRHGGKVWVESELNRGTTFHFTLPTDPALIRAKEMSAYDEM
jgi:two-component system sensor histidine kinase VicK